MIAVLEQAPETFVNEQMFLTSRNEHSNSVPEPMIATSSPQLLAEGAPRRTGSVMKAAWIALRSLERRPLISSGRCFFAAASFLFRRRDEADGV